MRKTKMKRLFSTFMALTLILLYLPIGSFASTDRYEYDGTNQSGGNVIMSPSQSVGTVIFDVKQTVGGNQSFLAYCIDLLTTIQSGSEYEVAFLEDVSYLMSNPGRIRNVVYSSYPNKTISQLNAIPGATWNLNSSEAIRATQAAIWTLANGNTLVSPSSGDVKEFYDYLLGLLSLPMPAVATIDVAGLATSIDGNDLKIEFYYNVSGSNSDSSPVTVMLNDSNAVGFTVVETPGTGSYSGYQHVTMTKPIANFTTLNDYSFAVSIEGAQTLEDVYVFNPVEGRDDTQTLISKGFVNTNSLKREVFIDLEDYLGSLTINKSYTYNNGSPYTGPEAVEASFELVGDYMIASGTTSNLTLTFNNLLPGSYTLNETSSGNYSSSLEIQGESTIEIPFNGNMTKDVVNKLETEEPGSIKVIKSYPQSDGEGPEVDFNLIVGQDTLNETTVEHEAIFGQLMPGTYTLSEVVPNGYETLFETSQLVTSINSNTVSVVVEEGQQTVVNVQNTPIEEEEPGSIKVIKSYPLSDGQGPEVDFNLIVGQGTLNETTVEHEAIFGELMPGTYTLSEVVPSGYETLFETSQLVTSINSNTVSVVVEEGEQTVVNVQNTPIEEEEDPGSIRVIKSYSQTDGVGPEVVFNLSDGEVVTSKTTVDHETVFDNLMNGTYTLTEVVPSGYNAIFTTSSLVSIVVEGQSVSVNVMEGEQTVVNVDNVPEPTEPTEPTEPPTEPPTAPPTSPPATDPPTAPPVELPQGTVTVSYVDTEGNDLTSSFSFSGDVGSNYITTSLSFDGYELVSTPGNASGNFINGNIDVVYVYSDGEELPTEPVPLGPAEPPVEPTTEPEPETTEPEEILFDEEVPLGDALPQTGQFPLEVFFGIGAALSLAGVSMKKKK